MTASDETGWEFGTESRTYANTGLTADGRETAVAWEITRPSPRSTALEPEGRRRETFTFPIRSREARTFTLRARLLYRFAPEPGAFAGDGQSVSMAEGAITLPGDRLP